MTLWLTPVLLAGALVIFALAYHRLAKRFPIETDRLIEAVDILLPQTQCAQCGYPGCRPYAEAVVNEAAALNLCPPGGAEVHQALTALMGEQRPTAPPHAPQVMRAVIDESQCIGCTLCLPPCPVDAIVGASNKMHTVIAAECTGCELCIPACPVDCISLQGFPETTHTPSSARRRSDKLYSGKSTGVAPRGCINCSRCNPVCPVDLPAQELLHAVNTDQPTLAEQLGLSRCIECGLCDRACPSQIPMAQLFGRAKVQQHQRVAQAQAKQHYKERYAAHNARLAEEEQAAIRKRESRLKNSGRWS